MTRSPIELLWTAKNDVHLISTHIACQKRIAVVIVRYNQVHALSPVLSVHLICAHVYFVSKKLSKAFAMPLAAYIKSTSSGPLHKGKTALGSNNVCICASLGTQAYLYV